MESRARELKLPASSAFELPDLSRPKRGLKSGARRLQQLRSRYYDTPDLRLSRWGVSLFHRDPDGWCVILPRTRKGALSSRFEPRFEGGLAAPPREAVELVTAYVREAPLRVVADLSTRRRRVELRAEDGRRVADITDDLVSLLEGDRVVSQFRELGIELHGQPDFALRDRLVKRLRQAGAGAPHTIPMLARALGEVAMKPADVTLPKLGKRPSAEQVIRHAIASSLIQLIHHDAGVRLDRDDEDVHQARVATRRLRSDLRTFQPLLDRAWVAELRRGLKQLGTALGRVRDSDVLRARLLARLELLDEADGDAARELVRRLEVSRVQARREVANLLRGAAYRKLMEDLVAAARSPAILSAARAPAHPVLSKLVRRRWKGLSRGVKRLPRIPEDVELHRLRIRAKQCRYASAAVAPACGGRAAELADRLEELQDVLGEHQDAVLAREWLRREALRATPVVAFAAGQLALIEELTAARARKIWRKSWKRVNKPKLYKWLGG